MIYVKLNRASLSERAAWNHFGTKPVQISLSNNDQLENVGNQTRSEGPGKGIARKRTVSELLALEKAMLSNLHLIGVVPVP